MRSFFIVVAAAVASMVAADAAEARKSRPAPECRIVRGERVCGTLSQRSQNERAYERMRADSVDPGRTYGGYPDWARWALSPKGGGCVNC